jgi:hypothetical protein
MTVAANADGGSAVDAAARAAAAAAAAPPVVQDSESHSTPWIQSAVSYCREQPTELVAYICDLATAILVVAVQDIAFKVRRVEGSRTLRSCGSCLNSHLQLCNAHQEAISACAVLSAVSLACNWDAYRRGQRVVSCRFGGAAHTAARHLVK